MTLFLWIFTFQSILKRCLVGSNHFSVVFFSSKNIIGSAQPEVPVLLQQPAGNTGFRALRRPAAIESARRQLKPDQVSAPAGAAGLSRPRIPKLAEQSADGRAVPRAQAPRVPAVPRTVGQQPARDSPQDVQGPARSQASRAGQLRNRHRGRCGVSRSVASIRIYYLIQFILFISCCSILFPPNICTSRLKTVWSTIPPTIALR